MPTIELAYPAAFKEGKPRIHAPAVYGASPRKPFLFTIPTTGERPLHFQVSPILPDGLVLDADRGLITGTAREPGQYDLVITATNSLGSDIRPIRLDIAADHACRTPLLGWTSWNAFGWYVTQDLVLQAAELLVSTGLSSYGYQYVNVDSSWQGAYGGEYDAIQPNAKFPDMAAMYAAIHALGLKGGIYSTPMSQAWGRPEGYPELPGCTRGEPDPRYPTAAFPIGLERCEANNVRQWCQWGVDYLKYDWRPTDKENADLMKQELLKADRDIAFCVTVRADPAQIDYWQQNCCSYRHNTDSVDRWSTVRQICFEADEWSRHCVQGHYFDLDMLETGRIIDFVTRGYKNCQLTEDEQLLAFSIRALFPSPIQLSCDLSKITTFELALYCNEEILAINQDALGRGAVCAVETRTRQDDFSLAEHTKIYRRPLADGSTAVGFFNIGETTAVMKLPLPQTVTARDLWAKRELGQFEQELVLELKPHTVRMLKLSERS